MILNVLHYIRVRLCLLSLELTLGKQSKNATWGFTAQLFSIAYFTFLFILDVDFS